MLGAASLMIHQERARARRQEAEHLLDQLTHVCLSYQLDHGEYPVDDRAFARYLAESPKCRVLPDPEPLSSGLRREVRSPNPIWPDEPPPLGVVHYRRQEGGFLLWVLDEDRRPLFAPSRVAEAP